MQVISREDQVSLSDQAGDYARKAAGLNAALDLINTDFGVSASVAERLIANMKTLWEGYQQMYASEMKAYQALAEKLKTFQTVLRKFEDHELLAFHTRVSAPLTRLATWLQSPAPQSVQALMIHNDDGYRLQVEIEKIVRERLEEDQNYIWAKEEADSAISEAKTTIEKAEIEMTKIPWGKQKPARRPQAPGQRSAGLEHSYRYLDSAVQAYKEITDTEIEYHHSVEKAVSDLRGPVRQQARNAIEAAKEVQREIHQQINDIHQKREDLEKTLADGQGYSMRLEDTGFRSQWAQIYRKYSQFESELEKQTSYREAFSYLEGALIEARYQIARMREFENSK